MYGEKAFTTMKFTLTSFPLVTIESFIYHSGTTTLPLNPTNSIAYLLRSSGFKSYPLYKSGYMISAPLPWSIITIFAKNPLIHKVMTKASSHGCNIPFRSSSPKVIGSLFTLSLFLGQSIASAPYRVATPNMPF